MTACHSLLFTLESGQSGLGIYTSQRDAAFSYRPVHQTGGSPHRRLEGAEQLERLCQLYAALRLFTNIYQPSAKRIPFEDGDLGRADSKSQRASGWGCRRAMASSALMSCITVWMPARIERNPARRSRFKAAVRSAVITPAPLPR